MIRNGLENLIAYNGWNAKTSSDKLNVTIRKIDISSVAGELVFHVFGVISYFK